MKHLILGVFIYINLCFSLSRGQHYNRTSTRTCGDCQLENCPIPRQCLAGNCFGDIQITKLITKNVPYEASYDPNPYYNKFQDTFLIAVGAVKYVPD